MIQKFYLVTKEHNWGEITSVEDPQKIFLQLSKALKYMHKNARKCHHEEVHPDFLLYAQDITTSAQIKYVGRINTELEWHSPNPDETDATEAKNYFSKFCEEGGLR